jgi:hypothetical protein
MGAWWSSGRRAKHAVRAAGAAGKRRRRRSQLISQGGRRRREAPSLTVAADLDGRTCRLPPRRGGVRRRPAGRSRPSTIRSSAAATERLRRHGHKATVASHRQAWIVRHASDPFEGRACRCRRTTATGRPRGDVTLAGGTEVPVTPVPRCREGKVFAGSPRGGRWRAPRLCGGRADWTIMTIRERSGRYIQYDPPPPHPADEPIARSGPVDPVHPARTVLGGLTCHTLPRGKERRGNPRCGRVYRSTIFA